MYTATHTYDSFYPYCVHWCGLNNTCNHAKLQLHRLYNEPAPLTEIDPLHVEVVSLGEVFEGPLFGKHALGTHLDDALDGLHASSSEESNRIDAVESEKEPTSDTSSSDSSSESTSSSGSSSSSSCSKTKESLNSRDLLSDMSDGSSSTPRTLPSPPPDHSPLPDEED